MSHGLANCNARSGLKCGPGTQGGWVLIKVRKKEELLYTGPQYGVRIQEGRYSVGAESRLAGCLTDVEWAIPTEQVRVEHLSLENQERVGCGEGFLNVSYFTWRSAGKFLRWARTPGSTFDINSPKHTQINPA